MESSRTLPTSSTLGPDPGYAVFERDVREAVKRFTGDQRAEILLLRGGRADQDEV